jgi:hypothetical protein
MLAEDTAWFAAHPWRSFRVRRALLGDAAGLGPLAPGETVIIRKIFREARFKIRCTLRPGDRPETEAGAGRIWRREAPRYYCSSEDEIAKLARRFAKIYAEHAGDDE